MFASLTDIQAWLGNNKITVDDAMSAKPNIEATRIIKGQLAGVFTPSMMLTWADPDNTPELIRSIAGRLTAAYIYKQLYSEETTEIPPYAQDLYNQAIAMLADIRSGAIVVLDVDDEPVTADGVNVLGFWPNDTTVPAFTMDQEFA